MCIFIKKNALIWHRLSNINYHYALCEITGHISLAQVKLFVYYNFTHSTEAIELFLISNSAILTLSPVDPPYGSFKMM